MLVGSRIAFKLTYRHISLNTLHVSLGEAMFRSLAFILPTLVVILLAVLPSAAHADKIDDYVRGQMQEQHIPGLSLAVVRNGKVVKAKGYGFADLEQRTPATPETMYELASVTKQFTATAIMLLVQDGKVGLDDRISQYVKGTPN